MSECINCARKRKGGETGNGGIFQFYENSMCKDPVAEGSMVHTRDLKAYVEGKRVKEKMRWEGREKVGAYYECVTGRLKVSFPQLKRHRFLRGEEG